jgi:RHS repeat-associated protein
MNPDNLPSISSREQSAPVAQRWLLFVPVMLFVLATPSLLAIVDDHNPIGVSGVFEGVTTTAGAYNVLNHNATRQIDDIVVPGAIGKYGLKMTRYYNSRNQHYFNLMGPGWSHEYMWVNYGDKVDYPNGNVWDSHCTGDWTPLGGPLAMSDWLGTYSTYPAFRLADGGTVLFTGVVVNGTTYYSLPTYIVDPYAQLTTLTYNTTGTFAGSLDKVTEPGGRYLQFFYTMRPAPYAQATLTRVEAHGLGNSTVTDSVNYTYALQSTGAQPPNTVTQGWCLTTVTYSDSQQASYTYTTDNQPDNPSPPCPCPIKILPLVKTCKDVRCKGPMRSICYDYQDQGPHGAITAERYSLNGSTNGVQVSKITPPAPSPLISNPVFDTTYTETRADGPVRTFNYTSLHFGRDPDGGCPIFTHQDPAPQQFLLSYTDFSTPVHTTYLGYDVNWYVNKVTDANGHITDYSRGPPPNNYPGAKGIGQILQITHHEDQTHIDYTYYDESPEPISGHYLKQITDERGDITYHTRDTSHRITRTDHKNTAGTIIAYEEFFYDHSNNFGLVSTHHLPSTPGWSGPYQHFQYDGRGLLIAKTNPTTIADWQTAINTAPKTTYTYYTSGPWTDRVQTMTLPANVSGLHASETYEYDKSGATSVPGRGLVTKITHWDGKYQSFGYDIYGNKLWEENELRKRTSHEYDEYNRLTKVTDPLLNFETFSYLKPGASSSYLHTSNSVYTHTSRAGIVTTNAYDANFRKISSTVAGNTTWFNYDNVGNKTYVTDPRGTGPGDAQYTTYTDYDARNRKSALREPLSHTTHFYYDDGLNLTRILRPDYTTETKAYDAMNRLSSDTVPQTPQVSLTTWFGYWPSGKLFWETDPKGQTTYFAYNESDQMIALYYPDPNFLILQTWDYDDAHNLASRTTVNGNTNPSSNEVQHFTYDNRNRKVSMYWDNAADSATYGYDDASRLTSAANPNSTVTRQYDADDRLILDQQNVTGLGIKNVNYPAYDDDGKLLQTKATNQDGSAIGYDYTFGYDTTGRFQTITPTGGAVTFQYYYDKASNETERHNLSNGVNEIYPRDALNRMQSLDVIKGSTLGRETYTYDMMNRVTVASYTTGPADSFQYYQDGELNTATLGNLAHNLTYNLDTAGNRYTVVDNTTTTTYTPNVFNQYTAVTGTSITNGPNHEISDYQGRHYTYINDERLASVNGGFGSSYQLAYDALERCVKRTLNGAQSNVTTYYIYDGEKPILEFDDTPSHALAGYNLYGKGVDEILMRIDPSVNGKAPFYYQQNHEGSVTLLTNASGVAIERYRYDAFGAPTIYDGNWNARSVTLYNNRFLFTGREYNPGFGFYEYRARAYSPTLGRFMSEDPKLFDAGDYNLFRYCHNDPIDFTDPMGLDDIAISGEMDRLGAQASYNSLQAAEAAFKQSGRWAGQSQLIQHRVDASGRPSGRPELQQKLNEGKPKTETRRDADGRPARTGSAFHSSMEEGGRADPGYKEDARGHVHLDKVGLGTRDWSPQDKDLARGDPKTARQGEPVYRIDQSDPGKVLRLTPQTNPNQAPTTRLVTPLLPQAPQEEHHSLYFIQIIH